MNVISVIIGLMALIIALVGFIPLLGWMNWFVIPGAVVGLVLGLMSTKTSGRNINLVAQVGRGLPGRRPRRSRWRLSG